MTIPPGLRVLVVEDEPMLSLVVQEMLRELGCEVVASATRIEPALKLARELPFDLALLDVNLAGARIDPVADAAIGRGLPVLFVTGYGADFNGRRWPGPVLSKPYRLAGLRQAIEAAISNDGEMSEPDG